MSFTSVMYENVVRDAFLFVYLFIIYSRYVSMFPEVIMFSVSVHVLGAESAVVWMCGPALTL